MRAIKFYQMFFSHTLVIILLTISASKKMGLKFSFSNYILFSFGIKAMLIKWHHQDGEIVYSWFQSLSQEGEQEIILDNSQDTIVKILEHWSEAEPPPWVTETKKDCFRRVRGMAMLTASPLPGQHSTTPRGSPWPMVSPVGKRDQSKHPTFPTLCDTS